MKRTDAISILAVGVSLALLAACGSDSKSTATTAATTIPETTAAPTSSAAATTSAAPTTTTAAPTTTAADTTTTVAIPAQVAIWPDAATVFTTPEAAATDFLTKAFGLSPTLGTFQQGDARSGEIPVMLGEGSSPPTARSTLLLRQLAPSDGWFVLSAVNDSMTIDSPAALAEVPVGKLQVSGKGRGFEALIVVEAFVAGSADKLDQQTAMGGSAETPEPFNVTLDLSAAHPGDTVVILIRGGVGLENDPGEFSAQAVTIAG
jgi:hypothetical protein